MRRLLLCPILLVGVLFLAGASPATSSAGNCTIQTSSYVWFQSQLKFNANLMGCTGVTAAQFGSPADSGVGVLGLWDAQWATFHNATNGGGTVNGSYNIYQTTYGVTAWGCPNPPGHLVYKYWRFKIKSGSTWGPWHSVYGDGAETIWC